MQVSRSCHSLGHILTSSLACAAAFQIKGVGGAVLPRGDSLTDKNSEPAFNVPGLKGSLKAPSGFSLYPNQQPKPQDIDQSELGNCYFDAVLASLAQQGPKVVTDMIKSNSDGSYTIRMYDTDGNGSPVTVDNKVPYNTHGQMVGVAGPNDTPNWATLVEKAFAKYNDVYKVVTQDSRGGYAGIASGGDPGAVFKALTGVPTNYSWHNTFKSAEQQVAFASDLRTALLSGQPVVTAATKDSKLPSGAEVVGSHAYTVMQVDEENGAWFVDIRNPWGITANVPNSSPTTDDGVLRMGFGDYVKDLTLTYFPTSSVHGADDSDTYNYSPGHEPVNGDDGGLKSGASRTAAGMSLAAAALVGAAALFVAT